MEALGDRNLIDHHAHPVFIENQVYGTRCSTVVAVDHRGQGRIIERRFDAAGSVSGESDIDFRWFGWSQAGEPSPV